VKCIFLFIATFIVVVNQAQVPIGQWQEHLPYNEGKFVCEANNKIYTATAQSIFYIDTDENSTSKLSKVNGLSETGISLMQKNEATNSLIIAYSNSNIDFIKNNKIINYSDVFRKNIIGDKTIYAAYGKNSEVFLSTGFGVVVVNELKNETKETYFISNTGGNVKVTSFTQYNNNYYAATAEGLKQAPVNSAALNNYTTWSLTSGLSGVVKTVTVFNNKLLALKNDTIFALQNNVWQLFYTGNNTINNINVSDNKLLVSESITFGTGKVVVFNTTGAIVSTIQSNSLPELPSQAIVFNNAFYIADAFKGLWKVEANTFTNYTPNAPQSPAYGGLFATANTLYAAAGSVNDAYNYTYNANGIMQYNNNYWTPIWRFNVAAMDSMLDFMTVVANDDAMYAGSFGGGLLQINKNNTVQVYKQNKLEAAFGDPSSYRVGGLALDNDANLWITNFGAPNILKVKQANNIWLQFASPFNLNSNAAAQIIIDNANQKWIVSPKDNGLICYNHGANITATNDDQWKYYRTNTGGLPSNSVNCIASDKDGILWVGTDRGIALIQCANEVFTAQGCNAILPIVQNDQFAGYLFQNEVVQTIAVDGANRKWVGTKNGVWLISSGGEKIIYRFSAENSALLHNDVRQIAINPTTGEVFFATNNGICSFRSTATEAQSNESKVVIFPNPVPANFNGIIGIKNLPNNGIVKIVETNGRLVYQTKALGGQAVWNGLNYKNQKINSGVYIVLCTSEDNNKKAVGKIFFVNK
jgi:hypothetical protein